MSSAAVVIGALRVNYQKADDKIFFCKFSTRGPMALNRSPEYAGQSQTFNFEIWVTFDKGQRMTFDTHSTSLTHLAECFKQLWDLRLQ